MVFPHGQYSLGRLSFRVENNDKHFSAKILLTTGNSIVNRFEIALYKFTENYEVVSSNLNL